MSEPEVPKSSKHLWMSIVIGLLIIVVLTPLTQFLTIGAINADVETAAPSGWALGLLISLVLCFGVIRLLAKWQLPRSHLAMIYAMLALAVPLMNIGLIRQLYLTTASVYVEYLNFGNSTYRTAYNARASHWFPHVPDYEGLAWSRSERLVKLVEDRALTSARASMRREAEKALNRSDFASISGLIEPLLVEDVDAIISKLDPATEASLIEELQRKRAQKAEKSQALLNSLLATLSGFDEFAASLTTRNVRDADFSSMQRIEQELALLDDEAREQLRAKTLAIEAQSKELAMQISRLSESDYATLISELAAIEAKDYEAMGDDAVRAIRESYVYRLTRTERNELLSADGADGGPNHNLSAFSQGLYNSILEAQQRENRSFSENIADTVSRIPWNIWMGPILRWGLLVLAILLFFVCLAEWLRRKWVDRENLAFPLVELADHIIRHDRCLESASDVTDPPKRKTWVNKAFLIGASVGFLILSLEALGHYQITGSPFRLVLNVSEDIFAAGPLKGIDGVFLVLSPIVIGLLFLVNLEISLSVWVIFLSSKLLFWIIEGPRTIRDSLWVGYGGGREYPFQMEQLLGASLCFALILGLKSFQGVKMDAVRSNPFVQPKLNTVGLIILPLIIFGLLWSLGVTNLPLLVLASIVTLAIAIAGARARAETGLPTQATAYDLTRLPMIFGMTGFTGGKVFSVFTSLAFLPFTMIARSLPQHLENIELARRFKIPYRYMSIGGILAMVVAVAVGLFSFIVFAYSYGGAFLGLSVFEGFTGSYNSMQTSHYPLWITHFTGEGGLSKFTEVHWIRIWFIILGAAVFALLAFLRGRFLKFPLHPMGYMLVLLSMWFTFISPYYRGTPGVDANDTSFLWGSAFVAWLAKLLIIKYGGMNTYKATKPFFIGLVAGSVMAIFCWNCTDLICSILANNGMSSTFIDWFTRKPPYSPALY